MHSKVATATERIIGMLYAVYQLIMLITLVHSRRLRGTTQAGSKIIGGEATTISQVPYLVNLRRDGYFICGGTLITPKCVLTAAHCTHGVAPSSLVVHAGVSRLSDTGELRQVAENFVSPFFSPTNLNMDVAILKLASPLHGENIATIPICNTLPNANQAVKVSGWGVTSESNRNPSDQVRSVNLPVISTADCMQAYAGKALLTSSMFCAAVPGQKDSCSGDSGGPVVYGNQVCGIVSWGFGCARPEYPGVYTNVASSRVRAFITRILPISCQ